MRVVSVIGLPAANAAEYERLHAAVWPGVLAELSAHGIRNYSIHRLGELLISYLEYDGEDYDGDMARAGSAPICLEWQALCEPLQRPLAERAPGEWWMRVPEVFHMP